MASKLVAHNLLTMAFANSVKTSSPDVLKQLDQLWCRLDDFYENDPEAYRSFIQKVQQGAASSATPKLDSCLCADMLVSRRRGGSPVNFN